MTTRILYLDKIRAIAILLVVWVHAWDTFTITTDLPQSAVGWNVFHFFHYIGRLGVPLFLAITGALMLGRTYNDIWSFYRKRPIQFVLTIAIVGTIYAYLENILFGANIDQAFWAILKGIPIGAYHLWYLYMMVGLYISLPFISLIANNTNKSQLGILLLMSMAVIFLPWTINVAYDNLTVYHSYGFIATTYVAYLLSGFWLFKHGGLKEIPLLIRMLFLTIFILFALYVKFQVSYTPDGHVPGDGVFWYDSILIFVGGVTLCSILRDAFSPITKNSRVTQLLSSASYSIYLWHVIGIKFFEMLRNEYSLNPFVMLPTSIICSILLGIGFYYTLRRTWVYWLVR